MKRLIAILLLGALPSFAQVSWQTTHTTNSTKDVGAASLTNASLRIKVFPAYLDVEEEVEISVAGTVRQQNDPLTLEILGTFTLPVGAAVTGALLWDGPRLLQAKLLDRVKADSIYEDFVDRDSAPPPRPIDPLILERTATNGAVNTYRVRVYPVALNQARRFRLRYQLPPRMGVDGFEMRLQAALIPHFSTYPTVTTYMESGGGVSTVSVIENGLRRDMTLPRTLFIARSNLSASTAAGTNAMRLLPVNTQRQVMLKTSFGSGPFQGHYLNLYAGISDTLLKALRQRIEVVFYWKWHNPAEWKIDYSHRLIAQEQASRLLTVYDQLGLPGSQVGLLHDDSRNPLRRFKVGARADTSYKQAVEYLMSMQGNTISEFVNNLNYSGSNSVSGVKVSKEKFMTNMQVVKTLYSPDEGVVRHLVLVSAGPEYITNTAELNAEFDELFLGKPVSISTMKNHTFAQSGLDVFALRQARPIGGTVASHAFVDLPGFPAMSLLATIRNTQKAYDFSVACAGGFGLTCGTFEFHGKSPNVWSDTVEWSAYKSTGELLANLKVGSQSYTLPQDTATALVWAASASPFSEIRETYLGPKYGFVDANSSLLALERDSINGSAYADTGVPYAGGIPDYLGPAPGEGGPIVGITGSPADVSRWRIERAANGWMRVRIPGLAAGTRVEFTLKDLNGRRVRRHEIVAEAGFIRWKTEGIRAGTYLMQLRGPRFEGEKLILL